VSLVHWDDIPPRRRFHEDIAATWIDLGRAAGSVDVGVQLIRIEPGKRSTPAHVHGAEEEIFYVLSGSGLLWQSGATCRVSAGDCIVHRPLRGTHTLRADGEGMEVLAFGTRVLLELCYLPRAEHSWAGPTVLPSPEPHDLFPLDDAVPFPFPEPGERPANVIATESVEPSPGPGRARRDLGVAAGSQRTGIKHITVEPGRLSSAPHCHSADEEILVVLAGSGELELGDERLPVRPGSTLARPPGTCVAHAFRAGDEGMRLLAYGTRQPNDICFYPRSGKIAFWGVGVIGRLEQLDYWEGEED
jgi:uncharacterized cupin superfamily protein